MLNDRLHRLSDYPFQRLRDLLGPLTPPADIEALALHLGEPQHAPPALVARVLADNAQLWGRYPPVDGTAEFRAAVGAWLARRYGLGEGTFDADRQVLPIAGSREALFMVAQTAVPEEKNGRRPVVLIPNPFYQVYLGAAVIAGAETVLLPATAEHGFLPDLDAIEEETLSRTALMYLCTPSNPQGAVADLGYLEKAARLAQTFDFVLAVDECYAEIYTREPPAGTLQACRSLEGSARNVLVFHSLSKRSSVPGLRSGFVAGDPVLIDAFTRLRSYASAGVSLPALAASAALWLDETHVEENRTLYRAKFDAAEEIFAQYPGFRRPDGGFFLWLHVGDGEETARRLWREDAIRVLPGAYLAREDGCGRNPGAPFIRIALVHDIDTVTGALGRIIKVL